MAQATKSKGTSAVRARSATGQFVKQPEVADEPEASKPAGRRRTSAGRRVVKRLEGAEATADNGVSKATARADGSARSSRRHRPDGAADGSSRGLGRTG